MEKKLEIVRTLSSKKGHLQTRMQSILSSVDRSLNNPFYTKQFPKEDHLSLIIQFDNGIDPDPAFSGSVLGRIYLDEKNNLSLVIWPLSKEIKTWRSEILFPKVKKFSFEFLGPNTAPEKNETLRPITPNLAWRNHWPKSINTPPTIVRFTLHEEGTKNEERFAFILPIPNLITYHDH